MKIVIIDNFDSFTYNLVHICEQFADNIHVIRYNKVNVDKLVIYDKIILSPGPGLPSDLKNLYEIIEKYSPSKAILGICLGHQGIAEYFGATLENLTLVKHGVSSKINQCNNCSIFNN